jgi:ankyrin repeat protein
LATAERRLKEQTEVDARFRPAVAAIKSGDLEGLQALLRKDPRLAAARSNCSHPTLLQCLALEAREIPNQVEMAQALIAAGAPLDENLVAAASGNNAPVAAALLDAGAAIDGAGGWSALEEALYWSHAEIVDLLLARGAAIRNPRTAAALGRTDLLLGYFQADGTLKPEAVGIEWPFGQARSGWFQSPQDTLDNAFVYACMHNRIEAASLQLEKGAEIDAIPEGFDFDGTGLHYAALNGHREMVDFLLSRGADASIRDGKVNNTPAGWADHGGHAELAEYLRQAEAAERKQ